MPYKKLKDKGKKDTCKHNDWEIWGSNHIGCGYCNDCKQQVSLVILFNRLKERMEEAIEKAGGNKT